jgi:hypothetical protein
MYHEFIICVFALMNVWIDTASSEPTPGPRLFVYFAQHGLKVETDLLPLPASLILTDGLFPQKYRRTTRLQPMMDKLVLDSVVPQSKPT